MKIPPCPNKKIPEDTIFKMETIVFKFGFLKDYPIGEIQADFMSRGLQYGCILL